MSNLLKSKFFLGVLAAIVMLVGVAVNVNSASAATCSITSTLRVGSKGDQVKCLQMNLGLTADGSFGPKTKAAVVAWQSAHGLTADGVFGAKSRAAWMGSSMSTLPAGCTSTSGFSPLTGASCSTGVTVSYPAGCTSNTGYSSTTGASCATGVVTTSGPVGVMLAADNPASGYIIANQATADLAHFTFTGSGTVNTIVLHRSGVSDQNTLSNVYLYDGMTRLTDGYSFNNNGDLTMNSLNLAVAGSRTISVKADVANVNNASSLSITLTSYTLVGGTAVSANVRGNEMTYGVGNLASVYLATQASVAVPSATVNAGTSAYTVWSAPVQVNTRAVWLKGANFRTIGSAPSDALANVKLYVDGVDSGKVATMSSITGSNYWSFDFSAMPIQLTTGTHTVDVRANIVKGSSYTVQVSVQQAADLVIYDPQIGVNVAPAVNGSTAFTSNNAGTITIAAGSASVTVDPTFQSLTNITGGATNTVIAKFKVHGYGEDVKVQTLSVLPVMGSSPTLATGTCTANTDCSLNNVTVYFNGSQVGSSTNWNGSGASTLSFNLGSQMILPAGADSYIEVRADLQNASSVNYTGGTVRADLKLGSNNGQGQTSHTTLNFPSADVTGTTLTIQTGVLAVSKNAGYANASVNPNTANTKIGSFSLQNQSSSESVRVTSLTVALTTDGSTAMTTLTSPALTNFSNLKTSETSGSGATPIQPAATNTFSVDFTLAPGTTKVVDVYADTGATSSGTVVTKLTVTSIGSSSNVSISQNGNGTAVTGQTITLAVGTVTNPPTLLSANSTSQQFVPAAGGASGATKATFSIKATGGSATISEMKITVNSQLDAAAVAGSYGAFTTGSGKVFTPTTGADANKFAVGDVVVVPGTTSNGVGTVTTVTASTSVTLYITVAPVGGTPTTLRTVPNVVSSVSVGNSTASVINGVAYLTGLNLSVPNGGSGLTQDVYVTYAPVGTNGVQSGATARVALEYIKYTSGGTTSTLCTAAIATCGATLSAGVAAPTMKLVGSRPSLALTASGSTLVAGTIDIGSVTVTADAKGDITVNALPLALTLSNASVTNSADLIVVKDKNGNTVTTTNTAPGGTTGALTTTITFTGGYVVSAGTSQTFHINVPFTSVTASTGSATMGLGTADLFSWTDTAGNATASTGVDVTGSAVTTVSNRYKDGPGAAVTPGFFYNYPTNTVNVNNF